MKKYLTFLLLLIFTGSFAQNSDYSRVPFGMRDTGPLTAQDAHLFDKIEEVKYLINLQSLSIKNLTISDFTWFYYMPKLESLKMQNCIIKKNMNLAILKGLKDIKIHNCKIKKILGTENIFNTDIKNNSEYY